ncbi:MAG: hypothetical protein WD041_00990 [Nitriliruptoraceae bacterium]
MTMRIAALIVLAVVLLPGCTSGADDELLAELASTRQAQAELAGRVADLERELAEVPEVEVPDLDGLDQRVTRALDTVEALREDIDLDRDARLEFGERVDDVEGDLRTSLADLRDELQGIRAEIADLDIRYQVLQERIDRLQ